MLTGAGGAQTARVRQLGNQGYADGYSGRPKRWDEPAYLRSYARGADARKRDIEIEGGRS